MHTRARANGTAKWMRKHFRLLALLLGASMAVCWVEAEGAASRSVTQDDRRNIIQEVAVRSPWSRAGQTPKHMCRYGFVQRVAALIHHAGVKSLPCESHRAELTLLFSTLECIRNQCFEIRQRTPP